MTSSKLQFHKRQGILLCVCCWVLSCLIFPTCLIASESSEDSRPVISSASEIGYPPFCLAGENGEATGFSVELLQAALATMGYDVSFATGPWPEVKQSLIDRRIEVLPLVGRTPEREAVFDFTFPYLNLHGTILVRQDEENIQSLADLKGKEIAVLKGDNAEEFLRRSQLGAKVITTDSFEAALLKLSQGQYDAVVIQKLLATQLIPKNRIGNLRNAGPPLKDFVQSFCFAVPKGELKLLGILNEGLSILFANGTFQKLHQKWFADLNSFPKSRLIIGGDNNYPPYEFFDENEQPTGFNVELTRAIAKELGLSIDIQLKDWNSVRNGLKSGQIDVLQGMFYSAERDQIFDFSPAHSSVGHAIITRAGEARLESMADLTGKSILVMKEDILHDLALKHGYAGQIFSVKSQEEALRLLAEGKYDCALLARIPALYWIEKNGWSNLVISAKSILTSEYCYAVPNDHHALLAIFSEGLATLKKNGRYREIYSKWFGIYETTTISPFTILKYSLWFLLPGVVLLAGIVFWNKALKRQVMAKTRELLIEIRERKEAEKERDGMEKQLRQKYKMEAVGVMAGGMAHNFNNNLAIIIGNLELAKIKNTQSIKVSDYLNRALSAAKKASKLILQIMTYSRPGTHEIASCRLASVVEEAFQMLKPTIPSSVDIQIQIPTESSLLAVNADAVQVEEILINLCNNAVHAMSGKGQLTLSLCAAELKNNDIPLQDLCTPGLYAKLSVQDDGCGILVANLEKIFDPFFTTKGVGEGTGIGLSTVHGIMKQYDGLIKVHSIPGKGTRFDLYFPVVELAEENPEDLTQETVSTQGSANILVVDDEEMLAQMWKDALSEFGYQVTLETSSIEALKRFKKDPSLYDLVITDQTMPMLTGEELVLELKRIREDIPVILCSGHITEFSQKTADKLGISAYCKKPMDLSSFIKTVEMVLNEA